MRKAIVAGLLAVLALAPSASAAPLNLAAGEQLTFTVDRGDVVRLVVDGGDAEVVVRHRGDGVDSFEVHCDASRPRFVLSHKKLVYHLQCSQRKK